MANGDKCGHVVCFWPVDWRHNSEWSSRKIRKGRSGSGATLFLSFFRVLFPAWNADRMLDVLEVNDQYAVRTAK